MEKKQSGNTILFLFLLLLSAVFLAPILMAVSYTHLPWGLFGLANMFEFLSEVKEITPDLKLMGIAVTKVDTRKNYFKQTLETLREMDDVHLFDTYIRVDSSIEWAQDNSQPVISFKQSSRSAQEYMELTKEVVKIASR